jgi:hypothetical protein
MSPSPSQSGQVTSTSQYWPGAQSMSLKQLSSGRGTHTASAMSGQAQGSPLSGSQSQGTPW